MISTRSAVIADCQYQGVLCALYFVLSALPERSRVLEGSQSTKLKVQISNPPPIGNLQFQKSRWWIDPNQLLCDINLNADVVRHGDQVFASGVPRDHQNLDSTRAHYFANQADQRSVHSLDATTGQLPLVEMIRGQLDSLARRHGQLISR